MKYRFVVHILKPNVQNRCKLRLGFDFDNTQLEFFNFLREWSDLDLHKDLVNLSELEHSKNELSWGCDALYFESNFETTRVGWISFT